jgi:hypothetical protein
MANETMMALGDFRFSVMKANLDTVSTVESWIWAEQNIIGESPVSQYVGKNSVVKTINGRIYRNYANGVGLNQINDMIEMANTATPLQLVDGAGNVYGDWVIMSIDYQEELIDQNATAKRITFKMQIKSY